MGPLGNRKVAWDNVAKPVDMATTSTNDSTKGGIESPASFKGAASLAQLEVKNYADKMGTHASGPDIETIGNGNVKKTGYSTPPADLYGVEGGRGMGGY